MGFAVGSLIIAKSTASKAAGFASIVSGAAGFAAGTSAFIGRQIGGRAGNLAANSGWLRDKAAQGNVFARGALYTANKAQYSTYDFRNIKSASKIPGLDMAILGKGKERNFVKDIDDKSKAKAKYAKEMFSQTAGEKDIVERAKKDEGQIAEAKLQRDIKVKFARERLEKAENDKRDHLNTLLQEEDSAIKGIESEIKGKEALIRTTKDEAEKKKLREELGTIITRLNLAKENRKEKKDNIENNDQKYKELKEIVEDRKSELSEAKKQQNKKELDIKELSEEAQRAYAAGNRRIEEFAEREKNSKFRTATQIASGIGGMVAGSLTPAAPVTSVIGGVIGATAGGMASGAIKNMAESKTGKIFTKIFGQSNTATYKKIMEQKTKDKNNLEKLADLTKEINSENK
jgi:hypothetical protein